MNANKAIARVPASTTNLGSGFDVLGLALQLYSTIELELTSDGIQVEVQGIGASFIAAGEGNLAYRAAQVIFEKLGKRPKGLRLTLTNGIPIERGLGGSGTAILGGLLTANTLCNNAFSTDELLRFAVELEGHPDNVSASLLGGFVVACVQEDSVHCIKLQCSQELKVVLVVPDFRLLTKVAREALPKMVPHADAVFNLSRSSLLVASIATGNLQNLGVAMDDRLHQPYRKPLIPGIETVFAAARNAGALSVALSGAGPTVAAFCIENGEAIADNMQNAFAEQNIKSETKILDIDYDGATLLTRNPESRQTGKVGRRENVFF